MRGPFPKEDTKALGPHPLTDLQALLKDLAVGEAGPVIMGTTQSSKAPPTPLAKGTLPNKASAPPEVVKEETFK